MDTVILGLCVECHSSLNTVATPRTGDSKTEPPTQEGPPWHTANRASILACAHLCSKPCEIDVSGLCEFARASGYELCISGTPAVSVQSVTRTVSHSLAGRCPATRAESPKIHPWLDPKQKQEFWGFPLLLMQSMGMRVAVGGRSVCVALTCCSWIEIRKPTIIPDGKPLSCSCDLVSEMK